MLPFTVTGNYTDFYQIAMAQVYFSDGKKDLNACFDYFFRKLPFGGGYVVFAGLEDLLDAVLNLRFTEDDLEFLKSRNFDREFLKFLKDFRFRGTIHSCREGELVFPGCPVVRVEGTIVEAQLIETLLLNLLNFESLIATKAARIKTVAGDNAVSEFGFRRAQGPAGVLAARAAAIGGVTSTSNVYAACLYGLDPSGTMAHALIQSYDSELEAFRAFAHAHPERCVFLVDTYDSLRSGVPNAITVSKELEQKGYRAAGIRLDSGDLAYLAQESRKMLDEAGLEYVKIVASNQLDEYVIKSLKDQQAPIDIFGVGTNLVTGSPDAALDGVYKLSVAGDRPRMKISENLQKMTLPGRKQVLRVLDEQGAFYGADAVILAEEGNFCGEMVHPFAAGKSLDISRLKQQPLLEPVIRNGERTGRFLSPAEIASFSGRRLDLLPAAYKRFEFPHVYKTGISGALFSLREKLRSGHP